MIVTIPSSAKEALRKANKKNYVPGHGDEQSKIMLVGDIPGKEEINDREPFVSNTGRMVDQCLNMVGLSRVEVYMTYLVKAPVNFNPSTYYISNFFTQLGEEWRQDLREEILRINPNVVIAIGSMVLKALTGKDGILKWRGSILESNLIDGLKVIPIINPAASLKGNYFYRYYIANDLIRAKKEMYTSKLNLPTSNILINCSPDEALLWLDKYKNWKEVACDIEVDGGMNTSCISFCYEITSAISIPLNKYRPEEAMRIWRRIAEILGDPEITKIGQNFLFDMNFLALKNKIITRGRIEDTMVAISIMYPDFPKSLAFICSMYTRWQFYKDEGKDWKAVKNTEQFWRYNAKDSIVTMTAWIELKRELKKQDYYSLYRRTMALYPSLGFMMYYGINTNQQGIESTKIKIKAKITTLQDRLDEIIYEELNSRNITPKAISINKEKKLGYLNVNSPKQLQDYFYNNLKIKPFLTDGRYTCDDKALQRLGKGTSVRKPRPEAYLIQELIGNKKFNSTYLKMNLDKDKRMRSSMNPRGTKFGRLSSSKTIFGTGMNMQNLPPAFKGFLVADKDHILMEFDKKQAEWVVVAYASGDANMIKILLEKADPHLATAELIVGLPPDIIKAEAKVLGHETDPISIARIRKEFIYRDQRTMEAYKNSSFIPRNMSCRQCGKKSNHGLNYGMGDREFALINETTNNEATIIYNAYHKAYPKIKLWQQELRDQLAINRTLKNCFGRKIKFLDVWGTKLFKAAYSAIPQSTVVDLVNNAMIEIYASSDNDLKLLYLLAQVHDSILYQLKWDNNYELVQRISSKITTIMGPTLTYRGIDFIIDTDLKVSNNNWSEDMREVDLYKPLIPQLKELNL